MDRKAEDFYFERPANSERMLIGKRFLPSAREKLFPSKPKIGLTISTFGTVPYVELALAVHRRLNPAIPVLVHDDASPERENLLRVCDAYGATFQSNSSRLGHQMGDLSAIVGGLYWARDIGLDLVVKMSRRFIPLTNWAMDLETLAEITQFATYGRHCTSFRLPFRSECFAMAVEPWSQPEIAGAMATFMLENRISIFLEPYVFGYAQLAYETNCTAACEYERQHVRSTPRPPFIDWPLLSEGRRLKSKASLWHDSSPPQEYAALAHTLGLAYDEQAFSGFLSQAQA